MRVLIVVSEAPPIQSGVARCTAQLTDGLRERGHEVDVISCVDVSRWSFGEFRFTGFATRWPGLSRQLDRYDVVNVHGPVPTMSDFALLLLRGRRSSSRPSIVYTHHSDIDLKGWRRACDSYNAVHRSLTRVADRVVVTSEAYRRKIATRPVPPVTVVPWGVDLDRFDGQAGNEQRAEDGQLRVLFVGQMRPYKGVDHLIDALAGTPGLSLTLVGSGPLEERYRDKAARLSANNVTFKGRVSDPELARTYASHDVVVLPSVSRAEAFGLVLLEGMAAGCVPVASDLPGVREVAGPTGILVRPGDTEHLRQTLVDLSGDPERRARLALASKERVVRMGWRATVDAYEHEFRVALEQRAHAGVASALPVSWRPPERVLSMLERRLGVPSSALLLFGPETPNLVASWGAIRSPSGSTDIAEVVTPVLTSWRPQFRSAADIPPTLRSAFRLGIDGGILSIPVGTRSARLVVQLAVVAGQFPPYAEADTTCVADIVEPAPQVPEDATAEIASAR
jgi:glycosyltransferase involved in cell wall biosynthesis